MAFLLKGGAIFLHIPKTGGSWVKAVLNELGFIEGAIGHEHATWDRVKFRDTDQNKPLGKILRERVINKTMKFFPHKEMEKNSGKSPFIFCFVRDPLGWYESWWKYMQSIGWREWGATNSVDRWHPNAILNGLGEDDFNDFVRNVLNVRPGYVTELYSLYTQPGINFIGKTENLRDDLITVLRHLEFDFDEEFVRNYKRVNVSEQRNQKINWEEDLRNLVLQTELPSLIHYNYAHKEIKTQFIRSTGKEGINGALQKILLQ